ncbi:PAS domain S-box protein [Sphingobacterium sp. 40-24]|uniref:sensor histidine kinase n=1 Tax=Sphingobacterium sp. 40-24 TaxID=1895843 RepID=UPI000A5B2F7B|nr:PAS domain S-box protein [Sphingobacterium sp. 40-24]
MHQQRDSLSMLFDQTVNTRLEGTITTTDDGTILLFNKRAQELLDLDSTADSYKIQELITFYTADDLSVLSPTETPFFTALSKNQDQNEIILGRKKDQEFKWYQFDVHVMIKDNKKGLLISFMDVSKLVNKNRVLEDKQHQLQLLVASLNDLVFEVTDAGVFKNYWTNNPDLLFYSPEEFLNKSLTELFPPDLAVPTVQLIQNSLKLDRELKMDFQSNLNEHKDKWYRLQIKPIHRAQNRVALVISDITKQVESNEKSKFNEHKFNQAFYLSGLGISLTSLEGYSIESNNMLTKILGYSHEEMSKTKFTDRTHPDDINKDVELREKLVRGEIDAFTLQKRYIHKLGHFVWCSVTVAAVFDNTNTAQFLIVQVQDISESKKNIEILKRQKIESDLVKIDLETKIRQLEEFANILAHDLKGPLSNIQMLIAEIKLTHDEKIKADFVNLLHTSSDDLTETLHNLDGILDIKSNNSLIYEQCNFLDIFKKVQQQFMEEIQQKNATISIEFNVKDIYYPKIYLESIFSNLISNALRFTATDRAPKIEIHTHQEQEGTLLTVRDNGLGINLPKYKSELFMFKKVFHRGFESKGVGLFLIRYQIESLGGKIDVQSKIDSGSTFYVKFLEKAYTDPLIQL